jgi:hypothetical protein
MFMEGLVVKDKETRSVILAAVLVAAIVAAFSLLPGRSRQGQPELGALTPLNATADAAGISSWEQAAQKVKEDRGEPTGRQAKVEIPSQLRHYADTRRFLAVQVAEWREHRFETPKDFADLAGMLRRKELVELKAVNENYILYGVGGSADKEPFTHYDAVSRQRVALYDQAGLQHEYERIAKSRQNLSEEIAALRRELNNLSRSERAKRNGLQSQVAEKETALKAEAEAKETLDAHYQAGRGQEALFAKYEKIQELAKDFNGRTYELEDAVSRKQLKVRMLSALRPEALKVLEEIASSYRQKFGRPLPVTSLVRPDEYQHQLGKVNPNATGIATPPHSTGLAFDVFYRFMTAAEQAHVMADLARLKDEGRIEVLRENRDHYHVFAFIDGAQPNETFISASLGGVRGVKVSKEQPEERVSNHATVRGKDSKRVVKKEANKRDAKAKDSRSRRRRR